ncbi:MAG TPA: hypothetical protein DCW31_08715 [Lactobacillus sp.]|nr:hypothetical protein [Lactobacillus sp.]
MKSRAELKQDAKNLLSGHWGRAILLSIIPILLQWFGTFYGTNRNVVNIDSTGPNLSNIQFHSNFWSFILGILAWGISLGVAYTFLDWIRNPKRTINPGTDALRVIGSASIFGLLGVAILTHVIVVIGFFLLIIPGIIFALMFSQTVYVYKDLHDSDSQAGVWTGVMRSLTLSRQLMDGHKGEYLVLQLSFIGWWLLVAVSFGIAEIWVAPYYNATMAAYYDELEANSNINIAFRDVDIP